MATRGQEAEVQRPCLGNKLCIYETNARDGADEAGGGIRSSEEGVGCVTTTHLKCDVCGESGTKGKQNRDNRGQDKCLGSGWHSKL